MKIIVLHGWGENPASFWYPYLRRELEKKGWKVEIPQLPNTNDPKLSEQLDFCLSNLKFDDQTILITHSSGTPLALAILEKIPGKISKFISVAGYSSPLKAKVDNLDTKNIKDFWDWKEIKKHCDQFIFINADNDPWGANDEQGREMAEKLGGKLIVNHDGHMGSVSFNQPYKEFPLLLTLID